MASFRPMQVKLDLTFAGPMYEPGIRRRLGLAVLALAQRILAPRADIRPAVEKTAPAEETEAPHDHDIAAWESEGGAIPPADERQHRVNLGLAGNLPCDRCHRKGLYLEPLDLDDRAGDYCGSCRDELIHGPILRRRRS